jgi:hypothetical protein
LVGAAIAELDVVAELSAGVPRPAIEHGQQWRGRCGAARPGRGVRVLGGVDLVERSALAVARPGDVELGCGGAAAGAASWPPAPVSSARRSRRRAGGGELLALAAPAST